MSEYIVSAIISYRGCETRTCTVNADSTKEAEELGCEHIEDAFEPDINKIQIVDAVITSKKIDPDAAPRCAETKDMFTGRSG